MISFARRNWKEIGWRNAILAIFAPISAALPWMIIWMLPVVQEVFFKGASDSYEWVILVFFYTAYFFIRGVGRLFFNIFSLSSILALVVTASINWISNGDCTAYCLGLINSHFGLACGYAGDGCLIENYILLLTVITFLFVVLIFRKGKKMARNL